jgi:hypothetical protein
MIAIGILVCADCHDRLLCIMHLGILVSHNQAVDKGGISVA